MKMMRGLLRQDRNTSMRNHRSPHKSLWIEAIWVSFLLLSLGSSLHAESHPGALFPTNLPTGKWLSFEAEGFDAPVSGVIYRTSNPPCCGVPLGGISTGCLDIDPGGTIGFCTIFCGYPRQPKLFQPFLSLSVGEKAWVLAAENVVSGGLMESCVEKGTDPYYPERKKNDGFWHQLKLPIKGVQAAKEIHYWGHYPVVDMEYETDAPVRVAMRAWSPFIPGDIQTSDTPAAVFEVRLENTTSLVQKGALTFSFSGPIEETVRKDFRNTEQPTVVPPAVFKHTRVQGKFDGNVVTYKGSAYALGVLGSDQKVRLGDAMGRSDWKNSGRTLPAHRDSSGGTSAAVDFELKSGETRTVRFLMAWHVPSWGEYGDAMKFHRMHTKVYPGIHDVINFMTENHEALLRRILRWQGVVYGARAYPDWLKDCLVNSLSMITETGYYAQPKSPLGDWCAPDGLFGMIECPRACPQIECIPCSWYGNMPVVYFFPKLARTTLRGYKQYSRKKDGAPPFRFGIQSNLSELDGYHWWDAQVMLNGVCYVDMVYRLWQRTGKKELLKEFYDSVKKSTTLTATMGEPPYTVVGFPPGDKQTEWWEGWFWTGIATHAAGMHLSTLMLAEKMAMAMGDADFVEQCRAWRKQGSDNLEDNNWQDGSYLLMGKPQTGMVENKIMSNQLDGEWANAYLGLAEGVFKPERVTEALKTIKRTCFNDKVGAVSFASRDGVQELTTYGIFPPETLILGMTYMYKGDMESGMKVCFDCMNNLVLRQGKCWDMPNMVNADTGEVSFGTDYYQMMMLWAVPAAIDGKGIKEFCAPGGFVDRILRAGMLDSKRQE